MAETEEFYIGHPQVPLFIGKNFYQMTPVWVKIDNKLYSGRVIANIKGKAQILWPLNETSLVDINMIIMRKLPPFQFSSM